MEYTIKSESEYARLAERTLKRLATPEIDLLHMEVGVITEVGELLDAYKRWFAYGKQLDWINVGEEWSDVAWYLVGEKTIRQIATVRFEFKTYVRRDNYSEDRFDHIEKIKLFLKDYLSGKSDDYFQRWISLGYEMGLDVPYWLTKNIQKLVVRYPEKFSEESALLRDTLAERLVLEDKKKGQQPWNKRFVNYLLRRPQH